MQRILFFLILILSFSINPLSATDTPYLLVLNKSDQTAWQINAETGEKVKSYHTGQGPHEVAVSPDEKWAMITNYGSGEAGHTLTLVNLDAQSVEKTIDIAPYTRPHGIDWFADSRRVIVTAETKKAVLVVDVFDEKILRSLPTSQNLSHMVGLSPDQNTAYVTNIVSGSVSVLDLKADSASQPTKIIKTGRGTEGLAINESTGHGWFSNRADHTLSVIDLQTHQPIDTLQSQGFPIRLAAAPNQDWIAATNAKSSEVSVFNLQSREPVTRIPLKQRVEDDGEDRFIGKRFGAGAVPIGVTFSDDSNRLYVSASKADVVAVIDTESWQVTRTIPTGTEPDGIAFFRK